MSEPYFFQFLKLHETPCIFGKIPAESPYPGIRIVFIVNKGLEKKNTHTINDLEHSNKLSLPRPPSHEVSL